MIESVSTEAAPKQIALFDRRPIVSNSILIVLSLVAGAAISYWRGQDINFDQLNYHYYIAYAYLADRLSQDVAPAQVAHSFFSPIAYLPFYIMVKNLPPYVVGMVFGALHGLNIWLVIVISWILTPGLRTAPRVLAVIASTAISAAGPMAISEFGTTFADILLSPLLLAGLSLLMLGGSGERGDLRTALAAGLAAALAGAAVSLKLTGMSFALALAVAAVVGWTTWRSRLVALCATAVGGLLGFAAAGGSWYLLMWRMFRNPVFPYFNDIFKSPDYDSAVPFFGIRYTPHNLWEALMYPFRWAGTQQITSELPFRDIRFALLIILCAIALGLAVALRARPRSAPAERRLIIFFAVAFGLWMFVWSIQRYIVLLELLTGPCILVLIRWCGLAGVRHGSKLAVAGAGLAVLCIATVKPTDWGHLAWGKSWFSVAIPRSATEHPIYFLDGAPLAYVVPELDRQSPIVEIIAWEDMRPGHDTVFVRRIKGLLANPNNEAIRVIAASPVSASFRQSIAEYGLRVEDKDCTTAAGRPYPLVWCPLVRN
nr:glycosyltransferase 87 family protein [uncultured Rhodopila sp.]